MDELRVELGERAYPIHFCGEAANWLEAQRREFERSGRKSVVVIDEAVDELAGATWERVFGATPRLRIEPGECSKSLATFGRVLDFCAEQRLDRGGVVWAVGGGVVGDLAGFAAASFLRGVDCVQVSTTLLAMVDSSVGGKTGINLRAGKNLVGAFHHPRAVLVAPEFLRTLPPREFAAGAAEVLKYGLLGDAALFAALERAPLSPHHPELAAVIRRCCELKAAIVRDDERETAAEGGRALLNLGHTFGHAIEQVAGYGNYLHGEAVAVGLVAAALLSRRLGMLDEAAVARVAAAVAAHGLPVRLRAPLALADLLAAMARDKKVRAGGLRFVVLPALGAAATRGGVPEEPVAAVWRELGAAG